MCKIGLKKCRHNVNIFALFLLFSFEIILLLALLLQMLIPAYHCASLFFLNWDTGRRKRRERKRRKRRWAFRIITWLSCDWGVCVVATPSNQWALSIQNTHTHTGGWCSAHTRRMLFDWCSSSNVYLLMFIHCFLHRKVISCYIFIDTLSTSVHRLMSIDWCLSLTEFTVVRFPSLHNDRMSASWAFLSPVVF